MEDKIDFWQQKMEAAARDLNFEEAKRCRDRISLMRGGATAVDAAQVDLSGLDRQKPGAMGLGTGQPRMTPPPGWQPPPKPDPMTSGRALRGTRRK